VKKIFALCLLGAVLVAPFSAMVRAEDSIEKAAVGVGRTVGNIIYVPVKALTVVWGAIAGAIAYPLSAGNAELTHQIWRDTAEGPYVITPDVAKMAIGERPELEEAGLGYR
jgi:hypothetical protein